MLAASLEPAAFHKTFVYKNKAEHDKTCIKYITEHLEQSLAAGCRIFSVPARDRGIGRGSLPHTLPVPRETGHAGPSRHGLVGARKKKVIQRAQSKRSWRVIASILNY